MTTDPNIVWKHRKGGLYVILNVAVREHDLTPVVVYKALQGGMVWVRPVAEFLDGRFTTYFAEGVMGGDDLGSDDLGGAQ